MAGRVILVGAGPGGAGLLTLRGLEALKSAEVVVYDRLVDEEILRLIPKTAERINVGKNVGDHPVPQHRINEILLEKAQEGLRVVRLKGGDCFVFGRGGEELELPAKHGVDFEVVPGITSALAVPAFAGIPVTHRDYCASVHIITGHRKKNESLTLDFDALVRLDGTLVFLMSLATFPEIARGLMAAGMTGDMPCAIIENGARPEQRRWVTTVSGAEACIEENKVCSPAIFVVGCVCALSEELDWFDRLPLKGRRILVAPPDESAQQLDSILRGLGARVERLPAPRTELLDVALPEVGETLLLPAAASVDALFAALERCGLDARALCGVKLICGGRKAEDALLRHGICADGVARGASAEALKGCASGGKLRLLCSEEEAQRAECADVQNCAAWRSVYPESGETDWQACDCIALVTLSGVETVRRLSAGWDLQGMKAVCIGEKVADAAREIGLQAECASEKTLESVAVCIARVCGARV